MRTRRDSGVTIVEAAFALPIMFLFIAAMIDLGMWTLNANQASNAARDGARAGILSYELADVSGSADEAAIVDAIAAKMDVAIGPGDVTIECVEPDGDPVIGGCLAARVDVDRIRVEVQRVWPLVTPIAGVVGTSDGLAEGSATMAIVGRPLPASPVTTTLPTTTTTIAPTTTVPTTTTTALPTTTTTVPPSTTTTVVPTTTTIPPTTLPPTTLPPTTLP